MKTILVTGAAQGIGLATAAHLAQSGYRVFGLVRETSDLEAFDSLSEEFSSLIRSSNPIGWNLWEWIYAPTD